MKKMKHLQQFVQTLALYFSRAYAVLNHIRFLSTLDATVFTLLIPPDHLLVRINKKLDFQFVNALCHPYYKNSPVGKQPIEPVKLFKMLLLLVFYGLLSERELVRQVQVNVAFRYFCGFSLWDTIPDHSTFTVFRKRIGNQTFKAIFVHILEKCIAAGLVTNEMYLFDTTLVRAHSRKIPPPQQATQLYCAVVKLLFGEDELPTPAEQEALAVACAEKVGYTSEKRVTHILTHAPEVKLDELVQSSDHLLALAVTQKPERTHILTKRTKLGDFITQVFGRIPHAVRDTSCRLISQGKTALAGYLLSLGVDLKQLVITVFDLDAADVQGQEKYLPLYEEHCARTKRCQHPKPRKASADSAFDIDITIRQRLEAEGVDCNIPLRRIGTNTGLFSPAEFQLKDDQTLVCPAGKELKTFRHDETRQLTFFKTGACPLCPRKAECTTAKYRTVSINIDAHRLRQRARAHNQTDAYKSALLERLQIEGAFGWGKAFHHLERAYYFDKEQTYNQAALFATAYNIVKLVLHS